MLSLFVLLCGVGYVFFFKQKTAYEMRISDWSSDVCSSDLLEAQPDWHDGKMDAAWAAAEKAGLDVAKARAMPSAEAMAWMEQDIADARAVGVRGTPTFFINGQKLPNSSPEQLEAEVRAAVAAKGKRSEEHTSALQSLMRI